MKPALIYAAAVLTVAFPASAGEHPRVALDTSKGKIVLELYADKAPQTVLNFLTYVDAGFYDGTVVHRVIPGFMIQGGGFSAEMQQKETRPPIHNEADNGLQNERGTIAMARTRTRIALRLSFSSIPSIMTPGSQEQIPAELGLCRIRARC